jgi:hypothetical protein
MVMTLTITDQTVSPTAEGIQLIIFRPSLDQLPKIRKMGDILRCHRLKIQKYENIVQGIASRGFSWVVIDGGEETDASLSVRSSSLFTEVTESEYPFTPVDKEIIRALRQWASLPHSRLSKDAVDGVGRKVISETSLRPMGTIANICPGLFFDCVVQVVAICCSSEASKHVALNPLPVIVTDYSLDSKRA